MSVPKSHRQLSTLEYIKTAIDLAEQIYTYANRLPNRDAFRMANPLFDHAQKVVAHVMAANRIYIKDESTFEQRRRHLLDAQGHLDAIEALLAIYWKHTQRITPIPDDEEGAIVAQNKLRKEERRYLGFADMITEERKLINGVKKRDREARAKQAEGNLP